MGLLLALSPLLDRLARNNGRRAAALK